MPINIAQHVKNQLAQLPKTTTVSKPTKASNVSTKPRSTAAVTPAPTVSSVRNSSAFYGQLSPSTTPTPRTSTAPATTPVNRVQPNVSKPAAVDRLASSPPPAANPYGAASGYYTSRGGSGGGGYGGGGGGGGGGGTGGGIGPGAVSEVLTGFAKRYLPAMIQDVLDNPDVIARDVLDMMGFDEMGPLGNLAGRNAGFFVNQILPLLYARDALGQIPSAGGMVNRTAEWLQEQVTPGGSVIDPMQILDMVLAESQKPATGTQTIGSSLFAGQTPTQQRSAMLSIIDDLANWLPNARFATGLRNVAASAGNEYVRQAAQATNPYQNPFGTFLRNSLGPLP